MSEDNTAESRADRRKRRVVAVFNDSADLFALWQVALEPAGVTVVGATFDDLQQGTASIDAMLREHRPRVIVFDVSRPYAQKWRDFERIRQSSASRGTQFIVTTTSLAAVQALAQDDAPVYRLLGKPYDVDTIVSATVEALHVDSRR